MNRQSFSEMRHPLPFLIFILSAALIFVSDYFLVDRLGENPLQSELSFLERERKRAILQEPAVVQNKEPSAQINPVFIYSLGGSLLVLLIAGYAAILILDRRTRLASKPTDAAPVTNEADAKAIAKAPVATTPHLALLNYMAGQRGLAIAQIGLGLLLLLIGTLYYFQGQMAMEVQKEEFLRILLVKEKNDPRRPWEIALDKEVLVEVQEDESRRKRGLFLLVFGGLFTVFSTAIFQSRRNE